MKMKNGLVTLDKTSGASYNKNMSFLKRMSKALFSPNEMNFQQFLDHHNLNRLEDGDHGTKLIGYRNTWTNDYFSFKTKVSMDVSREGQTVKVKLQHQNYDGFSEKTPAKVDVLEFEGEVNEAGDVITAKKMLSRAFVNTGDIGTHMRIGMTNQSDDPNRGAHEIVIKKPEDYLQEFTVGTAGLTNIRGLCEELNWATWDKKGEEFALRKLFPLIDEDDNGIPILKDVVKAGEWPHYKPVPGHTPENCR